MNSLDTTYTDSSNLTVNGNNELIEMSDIAARKMQLKSSNITMGSQAFENFLLGYLALVGHNFVDIS